MNKRSKLLLFAVFAAMAFIFGPSTGMAQVNSGSDGSDGTLDFSSITIATNIVIDMHDHPNGIYQYTSVNIPNSYVTISFIPNANNTPVTWLVQSNVVMNGTIDVSGKNGTDIGSGLGGPGGYAGGNGGIGASSGSGPGGGLFSTNSNEGGDGSYGSLGARGTSGPVYGNQFLIPLIGGSGGGGTTTGVNGGGGGGAILIAASGQIQLNGTINANGGSPQVLPPNNYAGAGSGGAVRLVATRIAGNGAISALSWQGSSGYGYGRIRFDTFENNFSGATYGVFTAGYQPILIPPAGQSAQLSIISVASAPVPSNPKGQLVSPDAIIPGQQDNPISVVVQCSNLPLNTPITVIISPAGGANISAVGYNSSGTLASSTATVSLNMPRGGGTMYATAATSN